MSTSILPPYLGSYEELVNALVHNPFLGSGQGPIHRLTADPEINPQPLPPRSLVAEPSPDPLQNPAVRYLATLASVKELGASIGSEKGQNFVAAAEAGIQSFLDDFCGTPPRRIPWPWPGPPPWVLPLAAELVSVANSQSGAFRETLMQIAGRVADAGIQKTSVGRPTLAG